MTAVCVGSGTAGAGIRYSTRHTLLISTRSVAFAVVPPALLAESCSRAFMCSTPDQRVCSHVNDLMIGRDRCNRPPRRVTVAVRPHGNTAPSCGPTRRIYSCSSATRLYSAKLHHRRRTELAARVAPSLRQFPARSGDTTATLTWHGIRPAVRRDTAPVLAAPSHGRIPPRRHRLVCPRTPATLTINTVRRSDIETRHSPRGRPTIKAAARPPAWKPERLESPPGRAEASTDAQPEPRRALCDMKQLTSVDCACG